MLYIQIIILLEANTHTYIYNAKSLICFKQKHCTGSCSLIYKEVENSSNVHSCLMDASRAFDRMHIGKLFAIWQGWIRLILDVCTMQNY